MIKGMWFLVTSFVLNSAYVVRWVKLRVAEMRTLDRSQRRKFENGVDGGRNV